MTIPKTMQWVAVPASGHRIRATPVTGDIVHYVPPMPASRCMAAMVTSVSDRTVSLAVYPSPSAMHPDPSDLARVVHDQGTLTAVVRQSDGSPLPLITCDDLSFGYSTWHFIPHPEVP